MSPSPSKQSPNPPAGPPPATPSTKQATTPEEAVHRKDQIGHLEGEALEATVGAVAGAVVGSLAGPIGIAAGAALGGAVGVALAHQLRRAGAEEMEHERQLDAGEEVEEVPPEPSAEVLPGLSAEELQKELG